MKIEAKILFVKNPSPQGKRGERDEYEIKRKRNVEKLF